MVLKIISVILFFIFASLGGFHFYWLFKEMDHGITVIVFAVIILFLVALYDKQQKDITL